MAKGQQRFVPVTALEELILLAAARLGERATQKRIECELSRAVGREISRNSLDTTIRRMEDRKLLDWDLVNLEESGIYFFPTELGNAALERAQAIRDRLKPC